MDTPQKKKNAHGRQPWAGTRHIVILLRQKRHMTTLPQFTNGGNPLNETVDPRSEIMATLDLFMQPGDVVELRVPGVDGRSNRVDAGFFNDPELLARAILSMNKRAAGVYITTNPLNPDIWHRSANQIDQYVKSDGQAKDQDVKHRRWLHIDFDPQRYSGTSSTDAEKAAALAKSTLVHEYLIGQGWPDPAKGDSGNGYHLNYRIDLPNDDEAKRIVEHCLKALAQMFSDDQVKIDRTTFNAARIWKVYGTTACKGSNTADRPHRMAQLMDVPEPLELVPLELLEELANQYNPAKDGDKPAVPVPATRTNGTNGAHQAVNTPAGVEAWMDAHGVQYGARRSDGDKHKWKLKTCPTGDHDDGAAVFLYADGKLGYVCHHDSCSGIGWKDLRAKLDPDYDPNAEYDAADTSASVKGATPQKQDTGGKKEKKPKQADVLAELAAGATELFTGQDGEAYAFVDTGGHRECHKLRTRAFRDFLTGMYYESEGSVPGSQALEDVIRLLSWRARGTTRETFVRVAAHESKIYIDLGTPIWNAIEIEAGEWRVIDKPPVAFRRPRSMREMVTPEQCEDPALLQKYINIQPEDFPLVAAWCIAALRDTGPYPMLVLVGEQGTAKSTFVQVLKKLIDPAAAELRGKPEDIRDLMIAASNNWLLAFDNISSLSNDVSDALCRIATGGGYATRSLYSDDEELVIDVTRPIVMNGITGMVSRSDLLDRSIVLDLPVVDKDQRRDEQTFWSEFERDRPQILGGLLTALAYAMGGLPFVELEQLPRMADFARLASAAESMMGLQPGGFMELYTDNREGNTDSIIEGSPLARPLKSLVSINGTWEGTATELLEALYNAANDRDRMAKTWPSAANKLSGELRRIAPSLRESGIVDVQQRTVSGKKLWQVERLTAK